MKKTLSILICAFVFIQVKAQTTVNIEPIVFSDTIKEVSVTISGINDNTFDVVVSGLNSNHAALMTQTITHPREHIMYYSDFVNGKEAINNATVLLDGTDYDVISIDEVDKNEIIVSPIEMKKVATKAILYFSIGQKLITINCSLQTKDDENIKNITTSTPIENISAVISDGVNVTELNKIFLSSGVIIVE